MNRKITQTRPDRRTQEQRRSETRKKLLDATVDIICEHGYARLTTAEVAARSGLTRGAVQHHFGNAADICIALVDDFAGRLDREGNAFDMNIPSNVEDRVSVAINGYWRNFKNRQYVAVVLVGFWFRSNPKIYPKLASRMKEFERRFDREWHVLFEDTGLPRRKIAAARHIAISALRGFAVRSVYRNRRDDWGEELLVLKQMIARHLSE
jgi:AcrR family transcriptional regulator